MTRPLPTGVAKQASGALLVNQSRNAGRRRLHLTQRHKGTETQREQKTELMLRQLSARLAYRE